MCVCVTVPSSFVPLPPRSFHKLSPKSPQTQRYNQASPRVSEWVVPLLLGWAEMNCRVLRDNCSKETDSWR